MTTIGQIRLAAEQMRPTGLKIHLVRPDGKTGCGELHGSKDQTHVVVLLGQGTVTCERNGCRT